MKVTCVICAGTVQEDQFVAAPCGHVFHQVCLDEWLRHQKSCPQCREKCLPRQTIKLYLEDTNSSLNVSAQLDGLSAHDLKERLQEQDSLNKKKDEALRLAKEELEEIRQEVTAWQAQYDGAQFKIVNEKAINDSLKLKLVQSEKKVLEDKAKYVDELQEKLSTLQRIQLLLSGTRDEAHDIIVNSSSSSLSSYVTALKSEFDSIKERKVTIQKEKDKYFLEATKLKQKVRSQNMDLQASMSEILTLKADLQLAEVEKDNLKKKVHLLEKAIESPNSRTSLQRILESPMPEALVKRPKLENDCSPQLASRKDDYTAPVDRNMTNSTEVVVPVHKLNSGSSSSIIISGFNGFGSQSKFIKPKAGPKNKEKIKFTPRMVTSDTSKTKLLARNLKF